MLTRRAKTLLLGLTVFALIIAPAHAQFPTFAPNIARIDGTEPSSGIAYTRLFISAQPDTSEASQPATSQTLDLSRPILTAECTRRPNGKYFFDLFINFGGVTDTAYYPPWKPANDQDLFPPATAKTTATLEFLGYTKYKPVKRQFEYVINPQNQLRYNPPSTGSKNLEDIGFYLQVLRALPTLRVTTEGHVASFFVTPLLIQLHAEPLCRASGL
jgi:hypothetical protein